MLWNTSRSLSSCYDLTTMCIVKSCRETTPRWINFKNEFTTFLSWMKCQCGVRVITGWCVVPFYSGSRLGCCKVIAYCFYSDVSYRMVERGYANNTMLICTIIVKKLPYFLCWCGDCTDCMVCTWNCLTCYNKLSVNVLSSVHNCTVCTILK